jgi:hypothetical protein
MVSKSSAFDAIRRARSLRERHPDAPDSVAHVFLVLATYADGRTGRSARPGRERLAHDTGLSLSAINRAVRWLIDRDELRRDYRGHRGSASCYSIKGVTHDTLSGAKSVTEAPKGCHPRHTTSHTSEDRSAASPRRSPPPCGICGGGTTVEDGIAACASGCYWSEEV